MYAGEVGSLPLEVIGSLALPIRTTFGNEDHHVQLRPKTRLPGGEDSEGVSVEGHRIPEIGARK